MDISSMNSVPDLFRQELEKLKKEARERAIAAVRRHFEVKTQKPDPLKKELLLDAQEVSPVAESPTSSSNSTFLNTFIGDVVEQGPVTSSSQKTVANVAASSKSTIVAGQYKGLQSARKRKRDEEPLIKSEQGEDQELFIGPGRQVNAAQPSIQSLRKRSEVMSASPANIPNSLSSTNRSQCGTANRSGPIRNVNREHLAALQYITTLIRRAQEAVSSNRDTKEAMERVQNRLNEMELWDFIDENLVSRSKVFGQESLFGVSFDLRFPWYVRKDAERLLSKWYAKDFNADLMRGITTRWGTKKKNQIYKIHSIVKDIPSTKAKYHGQGQLYNGQWWPLQICAVVAGAHGSVEGGIYGRPSTGAFSIVLSSGGYKDVDNGNTIKYCGTASKDGSVSAGTQQLIKSYHLGKEIRVLRNSAMSVSQSPYRPEKGIRFDGMYRIMSVKLLDAETMMHRFTMERCPGQDPIRYQGPEKRPTKQQLAKLDEL